MVTVSSTVTQDAVPAQICLISPTLRSPRTEQNARPRSEPDRRRRRRPKARSNTIAIASVPAFGDAEQRRWSRSLGGSSTLTYAPFGLLSMHDRRIIDRSFAVVPDRASGATGNRARARADPFARRLGTPLLIPCRACGRLDASRAPRLSRVRGPGTRRRDLGQRPDSTR